MTPYIRCLVLACSLPALGCTDPDNRFDNFEDQVIDAAVVVRADAPPVDVIPDVTGTFLLGMAAPVAPDQPFQFIGDIVLDSSGPTISLSLTPLHKDTREPIGDPFVGSTTVNAGGQFDSEFSGVIEPEANVLSGSELTVDGEMLGTIKTEDLFCGQIGGQLTAPVVLDLTGTTFAAIRVDPGASGDALPPVIFKCPPEGGVPDAGVPDAMPVTPDADAAGPDAAGPDAATPDAA